LSFNWTTVLSIPRHPERSVDAEGIQFALSKLMLCIQNKLTGTLSLQPRFSLGSDVLRLTSYVQALARGYARPPARLHIGPQWSIVNRKLSMEKLAGTLALQPYPLPLLPLSLWHQRFRQRQQQIEILLLVGVDDHSPHARLGLRTAQEHERAAVGSIKDDAPAAALVAASFV